MGDDVSVDCATLPNAVDSSGHIEKTPQIRGWSLVWSLWSTNHRERSSRTSSAAERSATDFDGTRMAGSAWRGARVRRGEVTGGVTAGITTQLTTRSE